MKLAILFMGFVSGTSGFLRGSSKATLAVEAEDAEQWVDLDMGTNARYTMCPPGETKYYMEEADTLVCNETCLREELHDIFTLYKDGLRRAPVMQPCTSLGYPHYWITTATNHISVVPLFDVYVRSE
jgi:hypothetical protein